MDPRPVDFAYRRPRHDNLTYQSYGISQSLFHIGSYGKKFEIHKKPPQIPIEKILKANPEELIHEHSSKWNVKQAQLNKSYIYENPSTFTNVHTRRPPEQLSKSMVLANESLSKSMVDQSPAPKIQNKSYDIQNLGKERIQNQADSLSNWTYSLMKPNKKGQMQDHVFEYQQKPYNIISNIAKVEPDAHRQYPRFSLEHKLAWHHPSTEVRYK